MKKTLTLLIFVFSFILNLQVAGQEQRFPKPEFETGYEQPSPTTPEPRLIGWEYLDIFVLVIVMSLAAWFVLRKRSRKGVLWLSVFTLAYFGFYREGCICSIGAIQNVALSFADSSYAISLTALAFFILPLVFSLFFGRVFCAGACPLGAIQDLVILKPISIPAWLRNVLSLLPFIYLGLAVLFAATGADFIICRYDPFVGIFRFSAPFTMTVLGISFLLMGLFVARPYCRFLCPYGVLLKWTSMFSKYHMSITPDKCIKCKLCTGSCPFDAIDFPTPEKPNKYQESNLRRFITYSVLIPVVMLVVGFAVSQASDFLAKAHNDVYLADLLTQHPEVMKNTDDLDIKTFMSSGKSLETLQNEAETIKHEFYIGSWILGLFLGLVISVKLLNQVTFRKREDYAPNKGDCFSCGKCMDYCPVKKEE